MTTPTDTPDDQSAGRPSLSGSGASPQITLRLPAELRDDAEAAAANNGESLSE